MSRKKKRDHTCDTETELKVFVMVGQVVLFLLPEVRRKFSMVHPRITDI